MQANLTAGNSKEDMMSLYEASNAEEPCAGLFSRRTPQHRMQGSERGLPGNWHSYLDGGNYGTCEN